MSREEILDQMSEDPLEAEEQELKALFARTGEEVSPRSVGRLLAFASNVPERAKMSSRGSRWLESWRQSWRWLAVPSMAAFLAMAVIRLGVLPGSGEEGKTPVVALETMLEETLLEEEPDAMAVAMLVDALDSEEAEEESLALLEPPHLAQDDEAAALSVYESMLKNSVNSH